MTISTEMAILYGVLVGLGSYAISSLTLFHFPELLHKPKNVKKCKHISHRGGAGENYENTMAAFAHAVKLGTNMLEMDCHLTKDKQVVVAHDVSLLRITGHDVAIKDMEYKQLPLLKTCISIDFEPGAIFQGSEDENSRKIPLLKDVFKAFPDIHINLDVKLGSKELIHEASQLIAAYQREDRTVWGSFKEEISLNCHKENPKVGRFFSLSGVIKLYLYFYTGLLPFISFKETHLEIPLFSREPKTLTHRQRWFFWIATAFIVRPSLFRHLEKRGIPTYVWVLNKEKDYERALNLGVAGIMTDYPTKLRRFLDNLNQ